MKLVAILSSITLAVAGLAWAVLSQKDLLLQRYNLWRYPPIAVDSSPLAGNMKKEMELRQYNEAARRQDSYGNIRRKKSPPRRGAVDSRHSRRRPLQNQFL